MVRTPLEKDIKAQILQYLRLLERKGLLVVFEIYTGPKIHNVGKRKVFLKNPSAGVSDLVILPKNKPEIWAELKRPKLGRQSPDQLIFEKKCVQMGHKYVIWTGINDMFETLEEIGLEL